MRKFLIELDDGEKITIEWKPSHLLNDKEWGQIKVVGHNLSGLAVFPETGCNFYLNNKKLKITQVSELK